MLRLAFACAWDRPPQPTWSHTPWQLREALRPYCDLQDFDLTYPRAVSTAFRFAYVRRHNGRFSSRWRHTEIARAYNRARLRHAENRAGPDVILQISDIAATRTPFFLVQDLSYDMLLDLEAVNAADLQFATLGRETIERLRDRQRGIYAQATGVIALSQWLARHLVEISGVPNDRVHVVHPGATAIGAPPEVVQSAAERRLSGDRQRLLFVGRDFVRKGGMQLLGAVQILRQHAIPNLSLTVVGPDRWPISGAVPAGVDFRGRLDVDEIATLFGQHDLFVLPSFFEAFGIVFTEALASGLPCIGRNAFAMPEIITAGKTGALVNSRDPEELAELIAVALADDQLVIGARDAAQEAASYYTWDRAARQTIDAINQTVPAAGG